MHSTADTAWRKASAPSWLATAEGEGPLLPILHDIQEEFGHVPPAALPVIAKGLNLTRAEVHGVVTFYHDYREAPAGRHVLKLCRAEACQSMGGDALAERLERELRIEFGETAADGSVTLEPVFCLGLCACAPAAMLDGKVIGRLDAAQGRSHCNGGARMTVTIYIPRDSVALALGADEVAAELARQARAARRRTFTSCATARAAWPGWSRWSRCRRANGRIAYGPVEASDVASLFDAGFLSRRHASQVPRHRRRA